MLFFNKSINNIRFQDIFEHKKILWHANRRAPKKAFFASRRKQLFDVAMKMTPTLAHMHTQKRRGYNWISRMWD